MCGKTKKSNYQKLVCVQKCKLTQNGDSDTVLPLWNKTTIPKAAIKNDHVSNRCNLTGNDHMMADFLRQCGEPAVRSIAIT